MALIRVRFGYTSPVTSVILCCSSRLSARLYPSAWNMICTTTWNGNESWMLNNRKVTSCLLVWLFAHIIIRWIQHSLPFSLIVSSLFRRCLKTDYPPLSLTRIKVSRGFVLWLSCCQCAVLVLRSVYDTEEYLRLHSWSSDCARREYRMYTHTHAHTERERERWVCIVCLWRLLCSLLSLVAHLIQLFAAFFAPEFALWLCHIGTKVHSLPIDEMHTNNTNLYIPKVQP